MNNLLNHFDLMKKAHPRSLDPLWSVQCGVQIYDDRMLRERILHCIHHTPSFLAFELAFSFGCAVQVVEVTNCLNPFCSLDSSYYQLG